MSKSISNSQLLEVLQRTIDSLLGRVERLENADRNATRAYYKLKLESLRDGASPAGKKLIESALADLNQYNPSDMSWNELFSKKPKRDRRSSKRAR